MNTAKDIRFRVYISFIGIAVFAMLIFYKALMIHIKEGKKLRQYVKNNYTKVQDITPERGNIFTENGSILSSSIPEFDLRIDFKAIPQDTFTKYCQPLATRMSLILNDKNAAQYKEIFKQEFKEGNQYFLLKKRASYAQYLSIKSLPPFNKGKNSGGFIAEIKTKRINPFGMLANRTVGLWRENAQNVGLENAYNNYLKGENGQRLVRKIAGGTWMPIDGSEIDPQNGRDIITTIDVNTQDIAENALLNQLEKEQATFGTCIVMEVKTGKIKAIANLGRQKDGTYYEDDNYAIRRLEPGSTFKLTSLISLLNDSLINVNQKVNCQGGVAKFGSQTLTDSHLGLGTLTIKDAFAHSSNVAFSKLIYDHYHDKIGSYWANLHKLRLDTCTGIDLLGERKPYINKDSVRKQNTLPWMGIGYMVMITPLHTCMIYNTVANKGNMMKPYLVSSIQEYGKEIEKKEPTILAKNCITANAYPQLIEALNEVVKSGTGKALQNPNYEICGKTGTAQVADKGIKYADGVYHGSFVGFFPKEDPQYTICVVIRTRKGSNNYYGGLIALPVFKEVSERLYATNFSKIKPLSPKSTITKSFSAKNMYANDYNMLASALKLKGTTLTQSALMQNIMADSNSKITYSVRPSTNAVIPNVTGMGLKDALYELEKLGLHVIPIGKGKVTTQSLPVGSHYKKGETIKVYLG